MVLIVRNEFGEKYSKTHFKTNVTRVNLLKVFSQWNSAKIRNRNSSNKMITIAKNNNKEQEAVHSSVVFKTNYFVWKCKPNILLSRFHQIIRLRSSDFGPRKHKWEIHINIVWTAKANRDSDGIRLLVLKALLWFFLFRFGYIFSMFMCYPGHFYLNLFYSSLSLSLSSITTTDKRPRATWWLLMFLCMMEMKEMIPRTKRNQPLWICWPFSVFWTSVCPLSSMWRKTEFTSFFWSFIRYS